MSDHFIRVSRRKLRESLERPLHGLSLCAIYIDSVEYHSQHLIVALGLAVSGQKTGLRVASRRHGEYAGERRTVG